MSVCVWKEQLLLMHVRSPCCLTNTVALAAGKDTMPYHTILYGTIPYRLASNDCSMGCTLAAPRVLSTMKKGPKKEPSWKKSKKKRKGGWKNLHTHKINFYCIRISVSHDNGDDILPFLSFSSIVRKSFSFALKHSEGSVSVQLLPHVRDWYLRRKWFIYWPAPTSPSKFLTPDCNSKYSTPLICSRRSMT